MIIINVKAYSQNQIVDSLKAIVNQALQVENPTKDDIKAAISLSDHYSKVSFDSSKHYGFVAFELSVKADHNIGKAVSLNSIGMSYLICGYYDSAFPYLDSALTMFKVMGDSTGLVFVRNNLANSMMRKGDYAKALRYYQENLDIATNRNEPENMILSLNNMGIAYFDWKKYDLALKYYRKGLDLLKEMGEEERTGPILNNIGEAYMDMGKTDSALIYFRTALEINQKYGKKRSILISMTNIGNIFLLKENYSEALDTYRQALNISESIPDNINTALINIKIGLVNNKLKKYKIAKDYLDKGLKMALNDQTMNSVLEAYEGLIETSLGMRDADQVYKYGNLYIALKDSLFNESSLEKITELETKYETAQKENEIAILKTDQQLKSLEIQLQKNLKYSLVVLLVILILAALLIFNRYKLKKDKEKSEVEKAKLTIEKRMLHSQMNPHFIFNSLNSINSFIGENNSFEAQNYLSKFARLMRLILDNSRKKTVALADEISALQLNLELEKLRFDGRFDFSITVSDEIDEDEIFIPPMLIQPFVENAIKHGIKGKMGNGLITLYFYIEDRLLVCVVEDNGVGREKTTKEDKLNKHVSLGTQVTLERLEILKYEYNANIGLEIIDLKDKNDIGTGTRVIVKLPYEQE